MIIIPLICLGNLTYWGEFFTIIGIGTPAQRIPVQVDTGILFYSFICERMCE